MFANKYPALSLYWADDGNFAGLNKDCNLHTQFNSLGRLHGFNGDEKGLCFGFACVEIIAFLSEKLSSYASTLVYISHLEPTTNLLINSQSIVNQQAYNLVQNVMMHHAIHESKNKLHPMINYQGQEANFITATKILNQIDLAKAYQVIGFYKKEDLLRTIKYIEAYRSHMDCRVEILYSDVLHAIAVGYDPRSNKWFMNNFHSQATPEQIANSIWSHFQAYENHSRIYLRSSVYCLARNRTKVENAFATWNRRQSVDLMIPLIPSHRELAFDALWDATRNGNLDIINRLLTIDLIRDSINNEGMTKRKDLTLYELTMYMNRPEVMVLLKEHGLKLPSDDAILKLAMKLEHYLMMETLIELGASVDTVDEKGQTVLHHAVMSLRYDFTKNMIEKGADVNARSYNDNTPLHLAVEKGRADMVILLSKNGANKTLRNCNGQTALEVAENKNYQLCVNFLQSGQAPAKSNAKRIKIS